MAAKLLHSLADDSPDLQRQIGCMTGIIQIFDRQQLISGRCLNQRRCLPPPPSQGNSKFNNGTLEADTRSVYYRDIVERNSNNYLNEKRDSTESSRASFSCSSRSSSLSSLDFGGAGQPEPCSMDRIIFPETPSTDPVISQTSASPKMGRHPVDLRNLVKDSMHSSSKGPSVQTTNKEGSSHTIKHKDSPRHLRNNVPVDMKEFVRALANLRDAQWHYDEQELPRLSCEPKDQSSLSAQREPRRFSYDGREVIEKIKDGPRLSLDSKESSGRITAQSRPSSVVARLMGLDMLPQSKPSSENSLGPVKTSRESPLLPLRVPDACRPLRLPKSPRSSRKDPTSPRWKNADTIMKPVSSSKFPNEPAPWKHLNNGRASPKHQVISSVISSRNSPSVFGEIEKRLKDIEFNQSGKDLRALKQILEAMQVKGFLETHTEEHRRRDSDKRVGSVMNSEMINSNELRTNRAVPSRSNGNGTGTCKAFESPIVIMKPGKLAQKLGVPASSVIPIDSLPGLQRRQSNDSPAHRKNATGSRTTKDHTARDQVASSTDRKPNSRKTSGAQVSSRSPQVAKDNQKSSGFVSPRLQQKKLEFDKRSRPPTPPSDLTKTRRQSNRRDSTESVSPGGRRRHLQKTGSERNNDSKNASVISDTVEPRVNVEDSSAENLVEIPCCQSPTNEAVGICLFKEAKDDASLKLSEEQPSPVSVLDSSAYMEGSPSPVKHTSHTLEETENAESNYNQSEELWSSTKECPSVNITNLKLPSEISRKKLESIDNLVQKLRRLNSTHDEAQTDYIASLCENSNPDHRYISEILVASGLLLRELCSGLTSFQLHPSGYPINPELFFVLEQTKSSRSLAKGENKSVLKSEKCHRKLIFDTVNELLAGKLGPTPEPWFKPHRVARKTLNAQKLLRELCGEIELLEANKKQQGFSLEEEEEEDELKNVLSEDVMRRSENWTDYRGEVSSVVLDVERSIFKDLVDEIVRGEEMEMQAAALFYGITLCWYNKKTMGS